VRKWPLGGRSCFVCWNITRTWADPTVFPPLNACAGLLSCTVYFLPVFTQTHAGWVVRTAGDGEAQSTVPWSIPALRLCGLCSMARYLYGMLQDCTVCSVLVVNKEKFYKKEKKKSVVYCATCEGPVYRQDHSCVIQTIYWNWVYVQAEIEWLPINRWRWRCTGSGHFSAQSEEIKGSCS